jgi:2-oxoglutarate dehydrogenase E2 component (dihydrolipoamide succinyltransferase)
MLLEIKVPSVGESVTEATLAQWYKKDGGQVRKGELLFVLETDKVTLEIEAEADGVLKISKSEGETMPIGGVVGTIDTEAAPEAVEEVAPAEAVEPPPAAPAPPAEPPPAEPAAEIPLAAKPVLPPSVRRLVAERNLDASKITGTGPGGRITKGDVILYLEQAAVAVPSVVPAPQR